MKENQEEMLTKGLFLLQANVPVTKVLVAQTAIATVVSSKSTTVLAPKTWLRVTTIYFEN